MASQNGHADVCQLLIQHGAEVNHQQEVSLLSWQLVHDHSHQFHNYVLWPWATEYIMADM